MKKSIPLEIAPVFDKLKSEIVWLHGRWIILEQLFGKSPERVDLLNEVASSYFYITQDVLVNDILITISRLTDKSSIKRNENLSLGQLIYRLDQDKKYLDLVTQLKNQFEVIKSITGPIRTYRDKKLAHNDFNIALKMVEPLPAITFQTIKDTLESVRSFMNSIELYFTDGETAYEAFSMKAVVKA